MQIKNLKYFHLDIFIITQFAPDKQLKLEKM